MVVLCVATADVGEWNDFSLGSIIFVGSETKGRNAPQVEAAKKIAVENKVDLRTIELDVASQESVDVAVQRIVSENGHLDVVIHNAGHMVFGPAEAFTPEQLADLYDINVLSTQRVNRAALPVLRKQGKGLVVWVGSTSTRGGTSPYLAPYFAAKAASARPSFSDWRIGSRKRRYLSRVTSSFEAMALFTVRSVAGVTISSRPTKTRTTCPGTGLMVSGKTLSMNPRGTM